MPPGCTLAGPGRTRRTQNTAVREAVNRDDGNNVEMHDYRKCKVSVNGRIGRTARLSETSAKVRYVKSRLTGNAAAGNPCSVADMASLLQAVRDASEQRGHPGRLPYSSDFSQWVAPVNDIRNAGLSTRRAQRCQHRRLLALLRPEPQAPRGQALGGLACRRGQKRYESAQSTLVSVDGANASGPSPIER